MSEPGVAAPPIQVRTEESRERVAWQRRLLPFMASMLVLLAVLAAVSNFYQAHVMQQYIGTVYEAGLTPAWERVTLDNTSTVADRLAWAQWRTLALLESQALRSRYRQANVVLMCRVYLIFIGFGTGVVMALIGAAFILGKLQEPISTVDTSAGAWRFAVQSSSPGLILAVLGTMLILATIWSRSTVDIQASPLYLSARSMDIYAGAESKPPQAVEDDILRSVQKAEEARPKK